ncbi:sigma-70 family RNA polymerase sigma factor [Sutcliffiella horikoshii]|uniref:Sigma-70 family RNA polymerase sigma factor n=1 Tax=Sutcliffiella horikoshii TaxID=79883 RepID=A0A5D4T9E7_9BACI|nr:sigma-70 family RNA polymerase sigma factor [Sutcliffiella horikoshii]TYS71805.1 sigma-70 family RNA polymerase sigma factor [Sutcliffiella horikoshii]
MNELEHVVVSKENVIDKEQLIQELMNENGDAVLHLVFTYVKNKTIAEDLTQEIFIKCYEKLEQFNHQSSIKTWLYRVASNHCKDYLKSWHYRKLLLNEKILNYIPSKAKDVEVEVIAKSEEARLTNAVMELPIQYREVVILHYYEELHLSEISAITSVNINTLKTRLKRAREILKEHMVEEV